MASFNKKNLLIGIATLAVFLPLATFASTQNYLVLTADDTNGVFSNGTVHAYSIDSTQAHIYTAGTYEATLYDTAGTISQNFFEVSTGATMEAMGVKNGSRSFAAVPADKHTIDVALPIPKPVLLESAGIRIESKGKVLFDKKLSTIPLELVNVKSVDIVSDSSATLPATVAGQAVQSAPQPASSVPVSEQGAGSNTDVGGALIIIFAVVGGVLVLAMWFRSNK